MCWSRRWAEKTEPAFADSYAAGDGRHELETERRLVSNPDDNSRPMLEPADMPKQDGSTSRRAAVNTLSNWVAMGIQVVAMMFLLSYVYKRFEAHYGTEQVQDLWGIYRLSVYFSMAVSFLSFGMSGSVVRLASESLATGDWKRLSETTSVARFLLVIAAAVGVIGVVLVSVLLLDVLNVPQEHRAAAARLFQLTALSGGFQLLYVLYRGLLQARQRYDLANAALVAEVLVRVVVVVVCFERGLQRLEVLGASVVISVFVGLAMLLIMVRRVLPQLRMSFVRLRRSAAKEVLSFGTWITVAQVSRQGLETTGAFLVSATLGTAAAGVYGIPQMLTQYLNRIASGMMHTLRPVASRYAVLGQRDEVARLYRVGTRLSTMLIALPVALLVTHGRPFIIHWIGPQMAVAYTVMLVYLGLGFLRLIGLPAEFVILATGTIRGLALSRLLAGVLGIVGALAVATWTDWGLHGLVVALFLPTALRGAIYLPLRMHGEAPVAWTTTVFGCVLPTVLAATVPAAAGLLLLWVWPPVSLWEVLAQMALASLPYAPVVWFAVLNADERGILKRALLPSRSRRRRANADAQA